jgi:uncharacterized protein (DUF1697 family)
MPRYVAFLRAINVGGHTVKMDRLRALFEAMGFKNVETFIASGNVIFDARAASTAKLEGQIEKALEKALGYPVATFLRPAAELAVIAERRADDGCSIFIGFLKDKPQKALRLGGENDEFALHEREVYWICRTHMSESAFSMAQVEKTLGMPATFRNVTTIRKLAAKVGGGRR